MVIYNDSTDYMPENGYSSFIDKVYKSRLTPAENGCWKIVFADNYYSDGIEVQFSEEEIAEVCNWSKFKLIPVKNNRWKISIENTSDIIRQKKGKFDIMIHSDLFLVTLRRGGCWVFYSPSSEEDEDDVEDNDESILDRVKHSDGDEYFDSDNDEDNIMIGLSDGNGDQDGF